MTYSVTHEIECDACDGEGFIRVNEWPFGPTCHVCTGRGWRAMTPDEEADAAERAYERQIEDYYGGSSPVTLDEQHHAAFRQKQELRR